MSLRVGPLGIEEDVPEKWAVAHRYLDLHKDEGLPWPPDVAQKTQVDEIDVKNWKS